MGIKIAAIVATRYDSKTLIPLLCSTYQKNHTFIDHPSNYGPRKTTIGMFGARLIQDQIVMEHVNFWFLQSYVSFKFL